MISQYDLSVISLWYLFVTSQGGHVDVTFWCHSLTSSWYQWDIIRQFFFLTYKWKPTTNAYCALHLFYCINNTFKLRDRVQNSDWNSLSIHCLALQPCSGIRQVFLYLILHLFFYSACYLTVLLFDFNFFLLLEVLGRVWNTGKETIPNSVNKPSMCSDVTKANFVCIIPRKV